MVTLDLYLTTAWDTRTLVAPDCVVEMQQELDPAINTLAT